MRKERTWPGFASAVNDSPYTSDQIMRRFGWNEERFLDYCQNGAPVVVHIALRTINNLGVIDHQFDGWRIESGWLVAPNNRKISLRRLERIADIQAEHAIRLVTINS